MITNNGSLVPADASNLVISEILYDPVGGGETEFLELTNISPSNTIDLTGVRFVEGIIFSFPSGETIPPGGQVIVARDQSAFETRYGMGLPVIGSFESGGLSGNDHLILLDIGGSEIANISYSNDNPWPLAPEGFSLVLRDLSAGLNFNDPAIWRASTAVNGTPASSDSVSFAGDALADSDNDGSSDLVEYALFSSPTDANLQPQLTIVRTLEAAGQFVWLTFTARAGADDLMIIPEISTTLEADNWAEEGGVLLGTTSNGDGTEERRYRFATPETDTVRAFLRVSVNQR